MPINLFGLYAEKLFSSIAKSTSTNGDIVDLGSYITNFTLDVIGDAGFGKYTLFVKVNGAYDLTFVQRFSIQFITGLH